MSADATFPRVQLHDGWLRLHDPRRFGAVLWHDPLQGPMDRHPLLARLGVEPLDPGFDGALLHRIIAPKSNVAKRYRVDLARPLKGDEAAIFGAGGLMLESDDKPLLPATFEPSSERSGFLTLHEGRYHQVRRMFAAIGNHVQALHRDRIGALTLPDDFEAGRFQLLDDAAIALIFA